MKKLVVIDDDPIDHFLIKHMLRGNEFFDTTTYTLYGSLILDYIEENSDQPEKLPDVILLDLNMPMFTGWDFLERMQAISQSVKKNIKVYVLTSSVRIEDTEQIGDQQAAEPEYHRADHTETLRRLSGPFDQFFFFWFCYNCRFVFFLLTVFAEVDKKHAAQYNHQAADLNDGDMFAREDYA